MLILLFVCLWCYSIAKNDVSGKIVIFAICQLGVSILLLLRELFALIIEQLQGKTFIIVMISIVAVIELIMFAFGWIWFTEYTGGYSIFEFVEKFGTMEIMKYPLMIQLTNFYLWVIVIILIIIGFALGFQF